MSFIENIFSIKDYGETHKIMRLLGLKIKFPKSEYSKRKKESPKNLPGKRRNQKTRFIKGCMKYRTALFFHIFLTPFTAYGILDTR